MPTQTPTSIDPIELINRVSAFYEIAWTQLLWFIAVAGAIVGVIVPLGIQWYQRRLIKIEEKEIKTALTRQADDLKVSLQLEMKSFLTQTLKQEMERFDVKLNEKEKELTKEAAAVRGSVFHVQGNTLLEAKHYIVALSSYIDAASSQLTGDDQFNLLRVLKLIIKCLQKISKIDFDTIPDIESRLDRLLKKLEKMDGSGRYTDFIHDIRKELRDAKERVAEKTKKS